MSEIATRLDERGLVLPAPLQLPPGVVLVLRCGGVLPPGLAALSLGRLRGRHVEGRHCGQWGLEPVAAVQLDLGAVLAEAVGRQVGGE